LETHIGFLTTGDVAAGGTDLYYGDVVIVAPEEVLGAGQDVAHDNRRSEGKDEMFVIGVQDKAALDVPFETDHSLDF
jgi:hypothetical protein